jgi:hypothetical protein
MFVLCAAFFFMNCASFDVCSFIFVYIIGCGYYNPKVETSLQGGASGQIVVYYVPVLYLSLPCNTCNVVKVLFFLKWERVVCIIFGFA